MKSFGIVFLFAMSIASGMLCGAPAEITRGGGRINLRSNGAEYSFTDGGFFHLAGVKIDNLHFDLGKLDTTYMLRGGEWFWEDKPAARYKLAPYRVELRKLKDGVELAVTAAGTNMKLTRSFTLRDNSPALACTVRIEIKGTNEIEWMNLVSCRLPVDQQWMRLTTKIENGRPVSRLQKFAENPFLDANGNFKVIGNYTLSQWDGVALGGIYDQRQDGGVLLFTDLDKNQQMFRMGLNQHKKHGYLGFSPTSFLGEIGGTGLENASHTAEASGGGTTESNEFSFHILPFAGEPEQLHDKYIVPLVAKLQNMELIDCPTDSGRAIYADGKFALWQDLPDAKIFRSGQLPAIRENTVRLAAARSETESFQLALRPRQNALDNVSISCSALRSGSNTLPSDAISWYAVRYSAAPHLNHTQYGMIGMMPDVLDKVASVNCPPDAVQPFLLTLSVPENAAPGVYHGEVTLRSGKLVLRKIPLEVKVWAHSLAEQTLTAALDFWWRYKNYSKEIQGKVAADVENMIVAHRGGARWLSRPQVSWHEDGTIKSIDFRNFDASMAKFIGKYKHKVVMSTMFTLGYGHVPQNNFLGKKEAILTPLWTKKLLSLATAVSKHLKEKKWNDIVVFDMFDEPLPRYSPMLIKTIELLRGVDPAWRFTIAGNYNPALKDVINYWNINMSSYDAITEQEIRRNNSAVTVYNPPNYNYNNGTTHCRGNYWWLYAHNIDYVYQWLTNCWAEEGYDGWDDYRRSSWLVPAADGVRSTLRLNATRDGIEDYEALVLLRRECKRLRGKAPELVAAGERLQKNVEKIVRPQSGGNGSVITQNPAAFRDLHDEIGEILSRMAGKK